MQRILVTGASGNTGKPLLGELSSSGLWPVAGLRGEPMTGQLPTGGEYRLFNYGQSGQMASALEGVDGLFLMVPLHEDMVAWAGQVVAEAKRQGVGFIVRLSGLDASPGCASAMGALHGQIDAVVKSSGIDFCILRCNSFMQNFSGMYRGMIRRHRLLALPEGAARSCFIDTADIAAVVARVFSDPRQHAGRVYDLSGPESLDNAEVAHILSELTGTLVTYHPATDEDTERAYRKLGLSPWRIEVLMSLSRYIRAGYAAQITDTVEHVLGRRAQDFRSFAAAHSDCWR